MEKEKFIKTIGATPLAAVDFIINNTSGEILLGKRLNRPAQGFWFVPGGRIRKNEKIAEAVNRISLTELGTEFSINEMKLLGGYDHIYEDNYFAVPEVSTHYVVLAYMVELDSSVDIRPDDQHSEIRWWPIGDLLQSRYVHQNTKNYFMPAR